jgi:hypothetical protein
MINMPTEPTTAAFNEITLLLHEFAFILDPKDPFEIVHVHQSDLAEEHGIIRGSVDFKINLVGVDPPQSISIRFSCRGFQIASCLLYECSKNI